jgi:hypothetical protein
MEQDSTKQKPKRKYPGVRKNFTEKELDLLWKLYFEEGLSQTEIAKIMDKSQPGVGKTLVAQEAELGSQTL